MTFELPPQSLHLSHDQLCDLLIDSAAPSNPGDAPATQAGALAHDAVHAHLSACPRCAAEYFALEAALSNFGHATIGFAESQLALLHIASPTQPAATLRGLALRARPARYARPLNWALAAAVFAAAVLPIAAHHRISPGHPGVPAVATIQSHAPAADSAARSNPQQDEALLEEIDNDLSASVPTAMQPLADPLPTQSDVLDSTSTAPSSRRKTSNE
jgi:anti-sigma factor RsiW